MSNDLPWASVFDSAANMRALSAIQADGLRAASELVDRFVQMAAAGLESRQADSAPPPAANHTDRYGASGLEPFVTSWWTIMDQLLRVSAPRTGGAAAAGPSLDLSAVQASGQVDLYVAGAGPATAEVWVHNRGATDMGKVALRCSDLLSHTGAVIGADRMRFEPDLVPLPARSSRGITTAIDIDGGDAQGTYRGMLLVDGHPDVWLPIELVVAAPLP
ncbi:Uncharacterised protein [Mycolicibacterium phlei]|uniref:Uncharacterized protein n=1 Tax=Mycolicibacterium phlei DSM 43239 = CCUG 21000 TaxID=1226750 RepID=A0A5N5UQJ2_MYCPH|nr:hypothetical protein [Mycolicibacterium phlei]VEG08336.1 Uncharacterised protein [Mycobacteroides chelonae]AMO60216.1 hypothetical protein MPHLCCUG_01391 [Mycolicibacterium phlei]EID16916.1 hypothetical protein MPHLEI_05342 [Mycolicibacterium phlei RIVM601174]KAB7751864.1 hypothetical protein MPHL21000_24185 [Mycolicibacterium phlei DSM 43239 = CCUG 21000]KXW60452.1 hypothetical protein MPHL43239_25905 [Mycolicibacterium phlei DSM 43239 = CCUG 21000]